METNDAVHYILVVLGLITFFLAAKPGSKLVRFKNIFWILGNLFFIAAFVFKYVDEGEISYTSIAMLLFVNVMMVNQGNKK